MSTSQPQHLTVIGVDGLDWPGLEIHLKSGACPNLEKLRLSGVASRLVGAPQGDGPPAWASFVTGVHPEVHGLWTREEAWDSGVRPLSRASWKVSPVWTRLEAAGVSTGGVAWPGSRPGASWPGVWFDEDVAEASAHDVENWALPRRVAPGRAREAIRDRRIHPKDITGAMLQGLALPLDRIDQSRDATLPVLAVAMAEAATVQAAALWLTEAERPQACFVHYAWLGKVRSMFEQVRDERWSLVIPGAWRFLDGLIGRLTAQDTTVMLVSPGWRGKPGVFLAAGRGVVATGQAADVRVLDVAPAIFNHFGLIDRVLTGRVPAALRPVASATDAPTIDPDPPVTVDADLLAQAAAWGFEAPPAAPVGWRAAALASLARAVIRRAPAEAARIASAALALNPTDSMALRVRATALALEDQPEELPALSAALRIAEPDRGWAALAMGAYHVLRDETALAAPLLAEAEADLDPDLLLTVATAWIAASRPAAAERVFKAVVALDPNNVSARIGLAIGAMSRRDYLEAEALLGALMRDDPGIPAVYVQWAHLCLLTSRPEQAARMAALAVGAGAEQAQVASLRRAGLSF